ncbi:hypothetical protein [Streptomyces sp. NPDC051561]|uniref:hypothetical protein n=1 Tax=Streptomyces sp. NPDC051561 TaxID=3365658 RepID=UPI003787604C
MAAFQYDPADLDEQALADLGDMTDEQLAAYFENDVDDDPEVLLLAGCGRPATRAPQQIDVYRDVVELPALDTYQPNGVHHD